MVSSNIKLPKLKTILEYLLIIIIVFECYTMIERDIAYGVPDIVLISLFSCFCFLLFFINNIKGARVYSKNGFLLFLTLCIVSLCMILIPFYGVATGMIQWMVPVFCCCLFALSMEYTSDIWKKFVNVVVVLAIVSLFFYFFGTLLNLIPSTRTAVYLYSQQYKSCSTYFGIHYNAQKLTRDGSLYRNTGIFIEAPMYNLILCLAMGSELSFQHKPRKICVVILAITILSTMTATGYIFLVIILFIRFYSQEHSHKYWALRVVLLPILLLVFVLALIVLVNARTSTASGEASFAVRMDHIFACLKLWVTHPIFGSGYSNSVALYEYTTYDQGISVGLPALLGRNGLLIFLMYLVPFINRLVYSFKHDFRQLYFWIGSFFLFFMTATIYRTIFIFLLCTQLLWSDNEMNTSSEQIDSSG